MKHNFYLVRDVVSTSILSSGFAPTDGAFMRDSMSAILRYRPLNELEYYQVGSFDDSSLEIVPCPARKCSNDAYKFPETDTKKLSKDDILALAKTLESSDTASKE